MAIESGEGKYGMQEGALVRFGVIMAGGSGERFWPLSRKQRPKQLLNLSRPDKSMLAEAVDRVCAVVPPDRVYIITGAHLVEAIRESDVRLAPENIVAEPAKRNTAGALCYITAWLLARHPELKPEEVSIAITTADHKIDDEALFEQTLAAALEVAEQKEALVICGIQPDAPETGYGYIQAEQAQPFTAGEGIEAYPVRAFHEKPNRSRAQDFISEGNYYWNSGMFFWRAADFLGELGRIRSDMANAVLQLRDHIQEEDLAAAAKVFERFENISIDYALMEHASRVFMIRGTFPWKDVGQWPALYAIHEADAKGNCIVGDCITFDAKNSVIYNEIRDREVVVAVAGVDDLIVVATEDAILVVAKDRAQDVRHLVKTLKEKDAPQV